MNEHCDRCKHSPASHQQWGTGPCDANGCDCRTFVAPSVYASPPEIPPLHHRCQALWIGPDKPPVHTCKAKWFQPMTLAAGVR